MLRDITETRADVMQGDSSSVVSTLVTALCTLFTVPCIHAYIVTIQDKQQAQVASGCLHVYYLSVPSWKLY